MEVPEESNSSTILKSMWEVKKSKFEYYGSIIGLVAASVTLSLTLGRAIMDTKTTVQPQGEQVVHHVVHLPYWESLVTQILSQEVVQLQMNGGINLDALKSKIPKVAPQEQSEDSRKPSAWFFASIGLALSVLLWSVVNIFRRPQP